MESELHKVSSFEVSRNQNSLLNGEVLPPADFGKRDDKTDSPPVEDTQVCEHISIEVADSSCKPGEPDSNLGVLEFECEPPIPVIVEDNPEDKLSLKSCLRTKSEHFNNSVPTLEECDSRSDRNDTGGGNSRKVRFFLFKKKINPRSVRHILNPQPLTNDENKNLDRPLTNGNKIFDVSATNSVDQVQTSNELIAPYRIKHNTCVTQPDVAESCDTFVFNQFGKTGDRKLMTSVGNVKEEISDSTVNSKGLLSNMSSNNKNLHLKESVLSNTSDTMNNIQENKPNIMDKLCVVNAEPNSTLSPTNQNELEVRRKAKFSKKDKHNPAANRPRHNVVLRESLLTNACANISTSFSPNTGGMQGIVNKDSGKKDTNPVQEDDPINTDNTGESLSFVSPSQNDEIRVNVSPQGKQKQAAKLNSRKKNGTESSSLESAGVDSDSDKGTSQITEMPKDSIEKSTGNLQTCQGVKPHPEFPTSPKGKQTVGKSDDRSSDDNQNDLGGLAFLKDGKSLQTGTNMGLFNMNNSIIANKTENNSYEDFGSLAQKLIKRSRKSSAPVKLVKGSPEATNVTNVEDASCSLPETSDTSFVKSAENTGLSSNGSVCEHESTQDSILTPLKKLRPKRERKNPKSDASKQNKPEISVTILTATVSDEQTAVRGASISTNISQKSSQFETSNHNPDSRTKEGASGLRIASFSGEQNVKGHSPRINPKNRRSTKHSITDSSEISKDNPKIETAVVEDNAGLGSENRRIEYLDLTEEGSKRKKRLVFRSEAAVESLSVETSSKKTSKVPLKSNMKTSSSSLYDMKTSDMENDAAGDSIEQSELQAKNISLKSFDGSLSLRRGRKGAKTLHTRKQKDVVGSSRDRLPESIDRSGTLSLKESTYSPTESVGEKIAKLSLTTKGNEGQDSKVAVASEVSHSLIQRCPLGIKRKRTNTLGGPAVTGNTSNTMPSTGEQIVKVDSNSTPQILDKTRSSRVRKFTSHARSRSGGVQRKRFIKTPTTDDLEAIHTFVNESSPVGPRKFLDAPDTSDLESLHSRLNEPDTLESESPCSQTQPSFLSAITTKRRKLTRAPLVSVPLPSTTKKSSGIKPGHMSDRELLHRHSIKNCFIKLEKLTSEDIKRHSIFAFEENPTKTSVRSIGPKPTNKRSPVMPSKRNNCITPENIPKLHKVMEDVISSDGDWFGWCSTITDFGQGLQLVVIIEGSKTTETVVSSEPPNYPIMKFSDQSTDTSDLGQL